MKVTLGGCSFFYPSSPEDLPIGNWLQYLNKEGQSLDEWASENEQQPDGIRKDLNRQSIVVERAYSLASFFSGRDAKATFPMAETMEHYIQFNQAFQPSPIESSAWLLPPPQLQPHDGITFGEFIDSKMIVQAGTIAKINKWEILLQLATIWLRKADEEYEEAFLHQGSARLEEISRVSIGLILTVGKFWEEFNADTEKRFTIFHPAKVPGGKFSKAHFERWGWVNFLKGIAKTKVFDIPGWNMNSIECARKATAYDVLVFASEEKDLGEAQYLDMQANTPK